MKRPLSPAARAQTAETQIRLVLHSWLLPTGQVGSLSRLLQEPSEFGTAEWLSPKAGCLRFAGSCYAFPRCTV